MAYRGRVKNGTIELEPGVVLPEGAEVEVSVVGEEAVRASDEKSPTLYHRLKPFIGAVEGLPSDMSINHDHYLYGTPKKE